MHDEIDNDVRDNVGYIVKVLAWVAVAVIVLITFARIIRSSDYSYSKTETHTVQMMLVKVDPPKHFNIVLQHMDTKRVTGELYVSKHCNRWREMEKNIGVVYNVTYDVYRNKNWDSYADYHVSGFCPR